MTLHGSLADLKNHLAPTAPKGGAETGRRDGRSPGMIDRDVLDVTESYRVQVRRDRLAHLDEGAIVKMLLEYDGKEIVLPRDEQKRPSPEFLKKKSELAA